MDDNVNHPKHYAGVTATVECIDITRYLPFALGNAVKYIWRAGKKGGSDQEIEDVEKAQWYLKEWECHSLPVDFRIPQLIFQMILQDEFSLYQHEAIWHILHDNLNDAMDTVEDWIYSLREGMENENH